MRWLARECQQEILETKRAIQPFLDHMSQLAQARVTLEWRAANSEMVKRRKEKGFPEPSNRNPWGCPQDRRGAWGQVSGKGSGVLAKLGMTQEQLDGLDL
jgi:hypothetical protein